MTTREQREGPRRRIGGCPAVQLDERTRELDEAREQQAAINDILRAISASPGDVQPVFDTVAKHAARICEAQFVDIIVVEDGMIRAGSHLRRAWGAAGRGALPIDRTTVTGRSICDKQTVHVADLQSPDNDFPLGREIAIKAGPRTVLGVPLLREGNALGTIMVRRTEVRPFEDKHIALLKTFADQAAIAIENARLLNELRQRTDDLSKSLEQQTATSEVLRVISSSPGDLEPVFTSMLENAVRICGAKFGVLMLAEGDAYRIVALHGAPPAYAEYRRREPLVKPSPGRNLARVAATKQAAQIEDLRVNAADPNLHGIIHLAEARTMLNVPMLKDNELVGQIVIYRQEVRPFTDKQVDLLKNFAAQAVIAIENARLLNELRQRTDDLSEALEHQTATSEVLKVISSSRGDLAPVFNALLENATRICDAKFGNLFRYDGEVFHVDAMVGVPLHSRWRSGRPPSADPLSALGRIVAERRTVHIADVLTRRGRPPGSKEYELDRKTRKLCREHGCRSAP